jgi:hypothetical protein
VRRCPAVGSLPGDNIPTFRFDLSRDLWPFRIEPILRFLGSSA